MASMAVRVAWNALIMAPVLLIVHDHVVCVIPAGVKNTGSTIQAVRSDETLIVTRALPDTPGPLVVYVNPFRANERCCGRIVGLPGDVYIEADAESGLQSIQRLHPGQLYVMDDSESDKEHFELGGVDSRDFGPLPAVMVEGSPLAAISSSGMRYLR